MKNYLNQIYREIIEYKMIDSQDAILVGISGGADSVCLLLSLWELRDQLGIAAEDIYGVHINHMLRGEAADADEAFVEALCKKLGVSYHVFRADIAAMASEQKQSVEEAGRNYRYACFEKLADTISCEKGKPVKIAVAHNMNDQAETILFHLIRGSGWKGLGGIEPVRGRIVRPLLFTDRATIEEMLASWGQAYCMDATNLETDYARNQIRLAILPAMEKVNSNAMSHLIRLGEEAREQETFLNELLLEQQVQGSLLEDRFVVPCDTLFHMPRVLLKKELYRCLTDFCGKKRDIEQVHIDAMVSLLYGETGKAVDLPYGVRVRKSYETLIFENAASNTEQKIGDYQFPVTTAGEYNLPNGGTIEIEFEKLQELAKPLDLSKKTYTKIFDYGIIKDTLCLRTPKIGDFILLDEEGHKKKLSRVFIDAKIDVEKRKDWPVLAIGHEIIWALGLRDSGAYRVNSATTQIVRITYKRKGEKDGRED